jgi:plasmid maintenance system killer protein
MYFPESESNINLTALDEIEVKKETDHTNKIEINEQLGMVMKYPKTNVANNIESVDGETDLFFQILKGCIEKIYDSETVYDISEYSADELDDFIQQLDVKTFKKVQDFFATMPRLHYEVKYTNSLGKEKNIVLNNLTDFFTLG